MGIILALASALASGTSVSAVSEPGFYINPDLQVAALYQAATPTPVAGAVAPDGSTGGIMVMGIVIVIIVLVPILIRRSMWTK
jgi:hypothetical protein